MRRKKEIKNKIVSDVPAAEHKDVVGEYLSFLKEEKLREFQLLGDFSEEGDYTVSDEIKHELIVLKKYLQKRENESLFAILPTKYAQIKLKLCFRELDAKQMSADLYLIEQCGEMPLETYIASYVDDKKYDFKQEARIAFNILLEEDVAELEEGFFIDEALGKRKLADQDGEALSKRMQKLSQNKDRDFIVEMYSEIYVLMMLDALAKGGELGNTILKEYNESVKEKKFAALGTKNLYTKLRKTLDEVIQRNGGFKKLEESNIKISPAIECFLTPVKEMETLVLETGAAPEMKKEEEKKVAAPSRKPASKSGGKKSTYSPGPLIAAKGGSAKKKEEKKAEKKKPVGNGKKEETPKKPPVSTPPAVEKPKEPSEEVEIIDIKRERELELKNDRITDEKIIEREEDLSSIEEVPILEFAREESIIESVEIIEIHTEGRDK